MNVLLAEFDLYKSVGGGQTVYRRLIETNPGITFYYFGDKEEASAIRPPNAKLVPFKITYPSPPTWEFASLDQPQWAHIDYLHAANYAAAAAHLPIDVVDVADYKFFGYMMGPALRRHGLEKCKVVLAMHGNVSETQRLNWGQLDMLSPAHGISTDQREQWQYRTADVRYGISKDYIEYWQKIGGQAGHYLNPLRFVHPPKVVRWNREDTGLSLNFIGRTEGIKGPDLFLELLTWLPTRAYRTARIIGPGVVDAQGVSSRVHLERMAARRGLQVQHHDCMTKAEMSELYAGRGLTVLPSRMDTFSLVALESLYAGCPTAVSDQAGVCRFLRETYPGVPFATLNVDQLDTSAAALWSVMQDYNRQRESLARAMAVAQPEMTGPDLRRIYESAGSGESFLCRQAEVLYDRVDAFARRYRTPAQYRLNSAGLKANVALRTLQDSAKSVGQPAEPTDWLRQRKLYYMAERTPQEVDQKVKFASDLTRGGRIDRARTWAELARLERVRGNDFVAATYDIRVMRAVGEDRLGMLPWVTAILQESGYRHEAETVVALYGPKEERLERGRKLLAAAREEHRQVPDRPYEFIEDNRHAQLPKVSIIVSLYKAANKLGTFLRMLSRHEWVRDGRAELVFVDSHSPTDEHAVFKKVGGELGITAVYARTTERETIQKAWNRGILLARAPYLSFLGVDEMVRPDCLPVLAGELDADPALDWVQGNSVITEVNPEGTLLRDVMIYQRIPYEQDLVYLETSYLSWVGGMYRKSIHERYGYYDESFGAAGDTEFKNRILPFIRSKTVPQTLGVFLNYPEERTTQSPRAEVEDLRAWYLHRSAAGVEYALANRPAEEAVRLLQKAVGYRKSYCDHTSTDLEFASEIAAFAAARLPGRNLEKVAASLTTALQAYRDLDWLPVASPRAGVRIQKQVQKVALAEARAVQSCLNLTEPLNWAILNDNRFEQHAYPWDGKALAQKFVPGQRALWMQTKEPIPASLAPAVVTSALAPADDLEKNPQRLVAILRQQADHFCKLGELDLVRDFSVLSQYYHDFAEGKDTPVTNAAGAGPMLCRLLADSQQGRTTGNVELFDRNFASFCVLLAELVTPLQPELGDAFDGLATLAEHNLGHTRAMELAARLLSSPAPAEAVKRHSMELDRKVLEMVQRAAANAKASGNAAYSGRLVILATAIQGELIARESRKPVGAVA